ncbi:uncharacterized protein [Spinacia oleracea]|uniref:Uncharacterized protein isoform X1 n=1 Tax=Spinacia oleracea TaxID=3562 RepID=A0ABM3QP67_SPIOL|nr:uncharacterized protein LOC130461187 isoform X1 [Spinacia oleracea]XP_056685154.1 uncharacterized protein LOC130461187 isoform X1 [Spinacia oleracea]
MEIQSSQRHCVSWSDLPTNVVQLIAYFLRLRCKDVQSFRGVCTKWWRATHISALLPRRISSVHSTIFSSSVSLLRPLNSPNSPAWMVLSVEATGGATQLFNPISRTRIPNFPDNFDLSRYKSTPLAKEYHIVAGDDHGDDFFHFRSFVYDKVVIFFDRCIANTRNCILVALSRGKVFRALPFHLSPYFSKAFNHNHKKIIVINDITRYKGKTYALDNQGALLSYRKYERFDFDELRLNCPKSKLRKRFVVMRSPSDENLYIVVAMNGRVQGPAGSIKMHFKVYKLCNTDGFSCWTEVKSFGVGDQVLFVFKHHSFFVPAAEFHGCQLRNCIVFSDDAFTQLYLAKSVQLAKYKVAVFELGGEYLYSLPIECYPGFPVMLWSPPPWVLQNAPSP